MQDNVEIRSYSNSATFNETSISGLACRFNQPYHLIGEYWEDVDRNAFDGVNLNECYVCLDHDRKTILGRSDNSTLSLKVLPDGLGYEFPIDRDDPDHLRTLAKIKRGDIKGSSWKFTIAKQRWKVEGNKKIRVIEKVGKLIDVCPVVLPANRDTYVNARSLDIGWETFRRISKLDTK